MATPVKVFPDETAVGLALATRIADEIEQARADGLRYLLGCPSGRSPHLTYKALAQVVGQRQQNLSGLVLAMMDDYLVKNSDQTYSYVDPTAHYSCHRFAHAEIVEPLNAAAAKPIAEVWFPDPTNPAAYDGKLRAAGGIDLFITASGAGDGHVAFNTPGSEPDSLSRVIPLPESTKHDNLATFPDFSSLDEVPDYGISVGIATIRDLSRSVVMILTGIDKQLAFDRISAATGYDPDWPATIVSECANSSIFADAAAARK
jgi:glucosamine-6-phosphate deaminase